MSQHALQKLVGMAIVDQRFRQGFLNGGRKRLLAQFDLATEEQEVVLSIRASSLEGFAAELERRLGGGKTPGMCRPLIQEPFARSPSF